MSGLGRRLQIIRWWLAMFALLAAAAAWPELGLWALIPIGIIPCPTCCPQDCDILNDPFTVDNLATDWDDRSGTWAVSSGKLTTTDASAAIVTVAEMTAGATGAYVRASITCATTSDIGRLIIAWVDDSNYWFCEVQPGLVNGTLKLFERSGGGNTQRGTTKSIAGYNAGETISVCMGIANGKVAVVTTGSFVSFTSSPTTENTAAGCGTGAGSSDVKFDDFVFGLNFVDDPNCYSCAESGCSTWCTDSSPVEITLTFAGFTNNVCTNCNSHNATFVVPDQDSIFSPARDCVAKMSIGGCCNATLDCYVEWSITQVAVGPDTHVLLTVTHTLSQSGTGVQIVVLTHDFGESPVANCIDLSAQALTFVSNSGATTVCNGGSVTCTATTTP